LKTDKVVCLEIAWHHLRGGDIDRALTYALDGAEAVLAVGAPHGAEEILGAIARLAPKLGANNKLQLLLARALIEQSKADEALPIIEELAANRMLSLHEQAEVAMMRASAEFLRGTGLGVRYCEATSMALEAAQRTEDVQLIARALFECARAAGDEGATDLFKTAEDGVGALLATTTPDKVPMAILAKSYCRFLLGDPREAAKQLRDALHVSQAGANPAQLAFIHSGLGITNYFMGRFEEASQDYEEALQLTRKVGDDSRLCTIAGNLCAVQMTRGDYDEALRYGKLSVKYGESCSSNYLLVSYTNLIDPYMLLGNESAAMECLEKAHKWMSPERRWRLRLQFIAEAASLALMQRNIGMAMDLISQLETVSREREIAIPMRGTYWKLKAFRMAQLGQIEDAYGLVSRLSKEWQDTFVLAHLDVLATKAWLERLQEGFVRNDTARELEVFHRLGAVGKRQLLVLQGFLEPANIVRAQTVRETSLAKEHSS
jgi:tetratricopeptide (TPR) repeat protein